MLYARRGMPAPRVRAQFLLEVDSLDLREGATQTIRSVYNLMAGAFFADRLGVTRMRCVFEEQGKKRMRWQIRLQTINTFDSSLQLAMQTRPVDHVTAIQQLETLSNLGPLDRNECASSL